MPALERKWIAEGQRKSWFNDPSVSLLSLRDLSVYLLAGEPGAGKTTDIKRYREGDPILRKHIPLTGISGFDSALRIIREAGERSEEIFFDGYDEMSGSQRFSHLAAALEELRLTRQAMPRIRMVSRTAHLGNLRTQLSQGLGKSSSDVPIYRLSELSEEDAQAWIREELGENAQRFVAEVIAMNLGGVVTRPIELDAFIGAFKDHNTLGPDRKAAWIMGIKHQLRETSEERLRPGSDRFPRHTTDERFDLAAFLGVAASMELVPRFPVEAGKGAAFEEASRTLSEAYRTLAPSISGEQFRSLLHETLDTRLFEIADGTATFHSPAMGQFLASLFLEKLEPQTVIDLLKDAVEGVRVAGPAESVAAEVARFHHPVFEWILAHDPDCLLKAVCAHLTDAQKERTIESLFQRVDLDDWFPHYGPSLTQLAHPNLAYQIRRHLQSDTSTDKQRYFAIDLAEWNNCSDIGDELAKVFCDAAELPALRENAAHALAWMEGSDRNLLRPLLRLPREEDPDRELLGCALFGLWPDLIDGDPFEFIEEPRSRMMGMYGAFLGPHRHGAVFRLTPEILPAALRWLQGPQSDLHLVNSDLQDLRDAIEVLAWEHLEDPEVLRLMAEVVRARIRRYQPAFNLKETPTLGTIKSIEMPQLTREMFNAGTRQRRSLAQALIGLSDLENAPYHASELLNTNDLGWILGEARAGCASRPAFVELARLLLLRLCGDDGGFERVRALCAANPALRLDPNEVFKHYQEMTAYRRRPRRNRPGFSPKRHEQKIRKLVTRNEPRSLLDLLDLLALNEEGWQIGTRYQISKQPRLKPYLQSVINLAKAYLEAATDAWITADEDYWHGGLVPLQLVFQHDRQWVLDRPTVCHKWRKQLLYGAERLDLKPEEVADLASVLSVPVRAQEIVAQTKRIDYGRDDPLNVSRYAHAWSEQVGQYLAVAVRQGGLTIGHRGRLLGVLALNGHSEVDTLLIEEIHSSSAARQKRAISIAVQLNRNGVFEAISTLGARRRWVAEQVWNHLVRHYLQREELDRFSIPFLQALFRLAVRKAVPWQDPPIPKGSYSPSPAHHAAALRQSIETTLSRAGDKGAWTFLTAWSRKEGFAYLRGKVRTGRDKWLRESWIKPTMQQLSLLASDRNKHFLATPIDLHKLVLLILGRLQPTFTTLDVVRGKAIEPALTQLLGVLLRQSLPSAIVNMEAPGAWMGERTFRLKQSHPTRAEHFSAWLRPRAVGVTISKKALPSNCGSVT